MAVHGLVIIRSARIKPGIDFGRVITKKVYLENLFLRLEILFARFILLVARLAKMVKGHSPTIESLIMPKAVNRICHMVACSIVLQDETQGARRVGPLWAWVCPVLDPKTQLNDALIAPCKAYWRIRSSAIP